MCRIAAGIVGIAVVGALACSDVPGPGPCEGVECSDVPEGNVQQAIDGASLFANTCSLHHSLEIVLAAPLSTRAQAWGWIEEMNEAGVTLPLVQEAAIVEYLCTLKGCIETPSE